jgi:hypothetical protein
MSRGVSLWTRPLRLRLCPGVLAALARSLSARIACGVVGAFRREVIGRVAGPPRGVLPVPGVRRSGVFLLPGVGPALAARRKGVLGWRRALGVMVRLRSGDVRCFLRAESDIAGAVLWLLIRMLLVDDEHSMLGHASEDAPTLTSGCSSSRCASAIIIDNLKFWNFFCCAVANTATTRKALNTSCQIQSPKVVCP